METILKVAPSKYSGRAIFLFMLCLVPILVSAQPTKEELQHANTLSSAFEKVADVITPSVVNINAVKKAKSTRRPQGPGDPFGEDPFQWFFPNQQQDADPQPALGTGVIVDKQGHILTNNHVVGDADEVNVRLHDQRSFKATVVGVDERTDLAVIQIKASDLRDARLGDSDLLKIGEWVIAAGNPFGLDNTITAGIVSAKGRSIMGGNQYEDFIQTDAAINPGNSGGPLVNLLGEVVGINTAIFSRSGGYMGIGFAIPINMAKSVMQSLISTGKVTRGWLGVGIQNLTEGLAKKLNYPGTEGALIGYVEPKGPAAQAGVKQRDIVVGLQGAKIQNINQLRNTVASIAPGKTIEMDIVRNGRKMTLNAKVEELPNQVAGKAPQEEGDASADLGIAIENLSAAVARRLDTERDEGVVVTKVKPGGLAASAGIQPRDIIVSIDDTEIATISDFKKAVTPDALKKGILIVVENNAMQRFVFISGEE